jgi:metal-dependent amidase/aminoacylase/carboxypeptidase family protein
MMESSPLTKDKANSQVRESHPGLLEKLIEFRQWMHKNAEGQLEEWETQKGIKRVLIELAGIPEERIKPSAGTGLIVEIKGENQEVTR